MVHQDQARLVLADFLETFRLIFEFCSHHAENGQEADQHSPEHAGFPGQLMLGAGQRHDFIVIHLFDGRFHGVHILPLILQTL